MARQARSLDTLLAEINAVAPGRNKASDGGLGDQAHASRASDHNPNAVGVWRARDFTHDPVGGLDCNELAAAVASLLGKHPALGSGAYVIWNGRIISTDRRSEAWRRYTGSNPHNHHCHISVATAAAGYDSTAPWGVMKETEDMPFTEAQLRKIVREEVGAVLDEPINVNAPGDKRFKGLSVRALLKRIANKTGAVG